MNASRLLRRFTVPVAAVAAAALFAGCGKPNKANIILRKENQGLQGQIEQLKRERAADRATIAGLSQQGAGTVARLEPARLDRLFTVHAIRIPRLSSGTDLDPAQPGDEGFKIYVEQLDQTGDEIKASGSFVIEAFDLAARDDAVRLGRWEFPLEEARKTWHSFLMRYEYVLTCPWQDGRVPSHPDVTARITFTDELTGRQFTEQHIVKVKVPPASPTPQTRPAQATQPTALRQP